MGDWGCHLDEDSPFLPQTKEDCYGLSASWATTWEDGKCLCREYWGDEPGDYTDGVWSLTESGLDCNY